MKPTTKTAAPTLGPMMAQYYSMSKSLPADMLLVFRLGDFYELFFDNAKTAAPILEVALTKRREIPMCGYPVHAPDAYLARLLKAGFRVAVAEIAPDPKPGQPAEREIVRILTPAA